MVCTFLHNRLFNYSSAKTMAFIKKQSVFNYQTNSFYEAQINACTTLSLSGNTVYGRPANEGDRCSD